MNRSHKLEIDINGRKKDLERFEDEAGSLKQRIAVLEFNRQNIKTEEAEAQERLSKIRTEVLQKDEDEKELNGVISVFNAQRDQSRNSIDEQERQLTGKKVLLASLEEKKEADLRTISRLQNDISLIENEVQVKREEIASCEKQLTDLAQTIEAEQTALQQLYQNYAQCETALTQIKAKQSQEDGQLKAQENEIRDIKKKLAASSKRVGNSMPGISLK
jgi:chromosome segregation protein